VLLYLRHGVELFISIQRALWIATALAEALVVVGLFHERLIRRYPFFTAFLTAESIFNVALMQTDIHSRGYAEAYRVCELDHDRLSLGSCRRTV